MPAPQLLVHTYQPGGPKSLSCIRLKAIHNTFRSTGIGNYDMHVVGSNANGDKDVAANPTELAYRGFHDLPFHSSEKKGIVLQQGGPALSFPAFGAILGVPNRL